MKEGARSQRGAPPKGEVSARERILATASELFYREGKHRRLLQPSECRAGWLRHRRFFT
jgi:hypothetical protein